MWQLLFETAGSAAAEQRGLWHRIALLCTLLIWHANSSHFTRKVQRNVTVLTNLTKLWKVVVQTKTEKRRTTKYKRGKVEVQEKEEKVDLLLRCFILSDHLFGDDFRLFQWDSRRLEVTNRVLLSPAWSDAFTRTHSADVRQPCT